MPSAMNGSKNMTVKPKTFALNATAVPTFPKNV